jgi:TolB protein
MKKLLFLLFFMVLSIAVLAMPGSSAARVYIDIFSPFANRLPIAIPAFKNTGSQPDAEKLSAKMAAVISQDLDTSGYFRILETSGIAQDPASSGLTADAIKWENWAMIGTEALVTGGFSVNGSELIAEVRLFDAVQRQLIVGKRYIGTTQDYRVIAHKFSNEILKSLTGEASMFETQIAFVKGSGGVNEIYTMDFDGAHAARVTELGALTLCPAWSPDAKKIAFTSYRDGNPDLYIIDVGSGRTEKVSRKKGINITPSWSPDGTKIALTLSLNNGNSEIYVMEVASRRLERMTDDPANDVSPSWSPDGSEIVFVSSRSGSPQVFIMEVPSKKVRRLTFAGSYNTSPDWSPKGSKIAYTGQQGGTFNIFTISIDGTQFQQLTHSQGKNEDPSWSPDGRFIAFSSNRTGKRELYIMRADGTGQKKITAGGGEKTSPSWSPLLSK